MQLKLKAEQDLQMRLEAASLEREQLARAINEKTAEAGLEAQTRQKVDPGLKCCPTILHLSAVLAPLSMSVD